MHSKFVFAQSIESAEPSRSHGGRDCKGRRNGAQSDSESVHMFNSESHDGDECGTLAGKVQSNSFESFGPVLYF